MELRTDPSAADAILLLVVQLSLDEGELDMPYMSELRVPSSRPHVDILASLSASSASHRNFNASDRCRADWESQRMGCFEID